MRMTLKKNLLNLKAVIMAGGKGTRLSPLKPILDICGYPMFFWVYKTLLNFTREIYLAITPTSPLIFTCFKKIITEGKGYEYDVVAVIRKLGFPTLIVPSDTPFIPKEAILSLFSCKKSICSLVARNGFVGISLWNKLDLKDYENVYYDGDIINVNTFNDYNAAKNLCKDMEYS